MLLFQSVYCSVCSVCFRSLFFFVKTATMFKLVMILFIIKLYAQNDIFKEVMIDPAGKKSVEIIPAIWVAVIYESKWYRVRCFNLVSSMTLTS